jgi:hypothetical protein
MIAAANIRRLTWPSFLRQALVLLLLLLLAGCSKIEMIKMKKKTDADVIRFIKSYKEAGVEEVEGVLNNYLALADDYERRGWGRYGAPGWIDELRSGCEARLAVFYKAVGKDDAYQGHVSRAITYRIRANRTANRKSNVDFDAAAKGLCELVEQLDATNIQPRWRRDVAEIKKPSSNQTTR